MATSRENERVFVLAAARATQNVRFASRDDVATVGNFHIRGSITRRALLSNPPPSMDPGAGREPSLADCVLRRTTTRAIVRMFAHYLDY